MIDQILLARLKPVLDRCRRRRMLMGFAIGWGAAALIAGAMLFEAHDWADASSSVYAAARVYLLPAGVLLGLIGALVGRLMRPDARKLARQLEARFPGLDGRLITAIEQGPDEAGSFSFLQEHLFAETIHHSTQEDWRSAVPESSLHWIRFGQYAALLIFVALWQLLPLPPSMPSTGSATAKARAADGVEVTPGDTELEKGASLVVLARFELAVPGSADLVLGSSAESERREPLTRSLDDPVFGGSVADVKEPFTYRIAWDGGRTRDFNVRVFEYPRLERSDVTLTYPGYTKLPVKRIEDTRHTSAVEGTRIDLDLTLNKPAVSAVLEPRKSRDESKGSLPALKLEVSPDKPSATLRNFVPAASQRYELVLTDADGRRSKQAVPFSFDVVPNRIPEMKLAAPKGDQKPSALQEVKFDGTVWDDFGVLACGLELTTPGGETVTFELGKDVPGKEKRAIQHLLRLEELKAVPDQLFAWHTWADDFGPDGKVRRTKGDLFFAEVRPFEEIFRQGAGMDGQEQQQQEQQGQGQQSPAQKLAELQKQIINATWKLQRTPETPKYAEDIKVVRDSQEEARSQAEEAASSAGDHPQSAAYWQTALQHMQQAIERLDKAATAPAELAEAVAAEQSAYQPLLKLRAREKEVSRANRSQQQRGQQSGSQGEQQEQQQLDQLELTKAENRYETQREAQAQQSAERREQMQVLNRLKELAQRQQDVNEKLKELQTALNEAKTEAEKEEARRQLKRLEEEQRQMLADADELQQRMEQQQNQSEAAEQRQQLDQARENMQQAAEAAAEGQAGQALASGTRAEQQMQQMREQMRQQSAGAFEQELREMRAEARELARKQEEIAKQMPAGPSDPSDRSDRSDTPRKAPSLGDGPDEEQLTKALEQQEQRTGDLVQRATELSEQAEPSEPLLSRQIYDTARQFAQDDTGAVKEAQREMLREGRLTNPMFDRLRELQESERAGKALRLTAELQQLNQQNQAARTGERAREGLNRLRHGLEQAAESVLGDDTAALRLAESQLEAAADAMQREMQQQGGEGSQPPRDNQDQQASRGSQREGQPQPDGQQPRPGEGQPQGAGQPREGQDQTAQNQPRNGRPPGQGQGSGQPQDGRQPGERPSQDAAQQGAQPPPENGERTAQNQSPDGRQPGQGGGQQGTRNGEQESTGDSQEGRGSRNVATSEQRGNARRRPDGANDGGGRSGGPQDDLEAPRGERSRATVTDPLTGEGFTNWSDSLREAEELIDESDLRNDIASARERARLMRLEMKRAQKKPDWAVVQLEIVKPLVEVRNRLREELARRDPDKTLVPVDRDPVPAQFSDNVRRYYEQLGKDE